MDDIMNDEKERNQFDPISTYQRETDIFKKGLSGKYKRKPVVIIGFFIIGLFLIGVGSCFFAMGFDTYAANVGDIQQENIFLMLAVFLIGITTCIFGFLILRNVFKKR